MVVILLLARSRWLWQALIQSGYARVSLLPLPTPYAGAIMPPDIARLRGAGKSPLPAGRQQEADRVWQAGGDTRFIFCQPRRPGQDVAKINRHRSPRGGRR